MFFFSRGKEDPLEGLFYIGSADWMRRNLNGRVEVIAPVKDRSLRRKLMKMLTLALEDERSAWLQRSDGLYEKIGKDQGVGSQQALMKLTAAQAQMLDDSFDAADEI